MARAANSSASRCGEFVTMQDGLPRIAVDNFSRPVQGLRASPFPNREREAPVLPFPADRFPSPLYSPLFDPPEMLFIRHCSLPRSHVR